MDTSDAPDHNASMPSDVLVVEDSLLIALDIEDALKRLGVETVRTATSVADALARIAERAPDFAIVDYRLGEEPSTPVAEALSGLGVKFVLATGYSEQFEELERLAPAEILQKPFGRVAIEQAVLSHAPR